MERRIQQMAVVSDKEIEIYRAHLNKLREIIDSAQESNLEEWEEMEKCISYLYDMHLDNRDISNLLALHKSQAAGDFKEENTNNAIDAILLIYDLMQVFKVAMRKKFK